MSDTTSANSSQPLASLERASGETLRTRFPGPRPVPVLGWRGNMIRYFQDPIAVMREIYQAHGPIAALVGGRADVIFAFGPDYNHQLMSDPTQFYSGGITYKGPVNSAQSRLGNGLLTMNGEQHRRQRRLILPVFHKAHLEAYHHDMVSITQQILDRWVIGERRDMAQDMQEITLRVVGKTLFGQEVQEARAIGLLIDHWLYLNCLGPFLLLPIDLPYTPYRRLLTLAEQLEKRLQAIIEHKRSHPSEQLDALSLLLQARDENGEMMSDAEIIGQANLLFIAGHETSANALTWTLFLLAQHPRVLGDLVDELHGVLRGAPPTFEQLNMLPLLTAVVKESMRILPPAVNSSRYCLEAFALGPYRVPKHFYVTLSHYITHHMPHLYPEPERFRPDRWQTISPSAYEYLPFSAGPRMCIGMAFAQMEVKIVLSMLLQRYYLAMQHNARIDRSVKITLSPKYGMPMHVLPATSARAARPVRGNIHEMVDLAHTR